MRNLIKITLAALVLTSCEVDPIDEFEPFIEDIKTFVEPKQETETQTVAQPKSATVTPVAQVEQPVAQGYNYEYFTNVIGNGPVNVLIFDIFTLENDHGHRVTETFVDYAIDGQTTVTQIDYGLVETFEYAANTFEGTSIISASRTKAPSTLRPQDDVAYNNNVNAALETTSALYVRALGNAGDNALLGTAEISANAEALAKTVFVGAIDDYARLGGSFEPALRVSEIDIAAAGGYDNVVFAYAEYGSTSHATPRVSAIASQLLHDNPNLTPQELKAELFNMATEQTIRIQVGNVDEYRTVKVL